MRIQPVKHYRAPALPLAAWNHADPAAHTERCGRLLRLFAGVGVWGASGLALVGGTACTHAGESSVPPPPNHPVAPGGLFSAEIPQTPAEAVEALFRVAPNLLETLKKEGLGRGATGCVAVAPASFLSEEDGVALVRAELEKAGLAFTAFDPATPPPSAVAHLRQPASAMDGSRYYTSQEQRDRAKNFPTDAAPFTFDAVAADGRVVVEFVSKTNVRDWFSQREANARRRGEEPTQRRSSSAGGTNLIDPALEFADIAARTPDAEGRIVVLVCDPGVPFRPIRMAMPDVPDYTPENYPSYPKRGAFDSDKDYRDALYKAKKDDPQYQTAYQAWHNELRRREKEAARPAIQRQLAPQIAYLREQGVLPPAPTED